MIHEYTFYVIVDITDLFHSRGLFLNLNPDFGYFDCYLSWFSCVSRPDQVQFLIQTMSDTSVVFYNSSPAVRLWSFNSFLKWNKSKRIS
jgi:hypothetical protein